MDEKQQLFNLVEQAKREKKWLCFIAQYGDIEYWFSPDEMADEINNNRVLQPVEYWEIRNPENYLETLRQNSRRARFSLQTFKTRLSKWREKD